MSYDEYSGARKDPNTAMVIEILAGLSGFLGIGYLYAGYISAGLLRLFGWWAFLIIVVLIIGFGGPFAGICGVTGAALSESPEGVLASLLSYGVITCVGTLCLFGLVLGVPVWSGLTLRSRMRLEQ